MFFSAQFCEVSGVSGVRVGEFWLGVETPGVAV